MRSRHVTQIVSMAVVIASLGAWASVSLSTVYAQSVVLFQEGFEDSAFASRGWYDGTGGALSATESYSGTRSLECRFTLGATQCLGGTPSRHLFAASDSAYISFYIKHSASFVGSGKPYHPHMFLLMTNVDPAYIGPAYTHLTAYIEEIGGVPQMGIQDGRNIDESRVGQDLTNITEQRAVAGCNGDSDGYGKGDCYSVGSVHWNGKMWSTGQMYFDNAQGGPRYKGDWHLVEAYFKLNGISGGRAAKDGIIRYWYDGALVMDHSNVVLRTGAQPTMKFNQFQIAPFIGDGSPVDQTFWIDDLMAATGRPATPPAPPTGGSAPAAPTNVRIIP